MATTLKQQPEVPTKKADRGARPHTMNRGAAHDLVDVQDGLILAKPMFSCAQQVLTTPSAVIPCTP